jgi:hypothetical protein
MGVYIRLDRLVGSGSKDEMRERQGSRDIALVAVANNLSWIIIV